MDDRVHRREGHRRSCSTPTGLTNRFFFQLAAAGDRVQTFITVVARTCAHVSLVGEKSSCIRRTYVLTGPELSPFESVITPNPQERESERARDRETFIDTDTASMHAPPQRL